MKNPNFFPVGDGFGFFYIKDISYCVLCQQCRVDTGLLALILFSVPVHRTLVRGDSKTALQFIRIPINWRFVLWNMGISVFLQESKTNSGSSLRCGSLGFPKTESTWISNPGRTLNGRTTRGWYGN